MARRTDPTPGHQRLVGLLAVAGLAAATAFAFGRVFAGRLPTWELVAAALASVAIAALFERRGLLVATLASLAGLALAITWIVLPQTAWYGLPTPRTLRAVGRSLEYVGQQARVRVAPTPPLPPLMLAAVTAVWTASFSAHALAIRAGSPLLAVLPPIALVGFADTVLDDGARPVYAVVLLCAALAVIFSDGLRRIRQWGPVWSSSRSRRFGSSIRGSRPVAAAVVLAAVLVPGILPGFRSGPLVDLSTEAGEGFGLEPFVSIQAQLDEQEARDLFEVHAEDGTYWRLYALDLFDGVSFTSSDPLAKQRGLEYTSPAQLPEQDGNDTAEDPPTRSYVFRALTDITAPWLPMPQRTREVTLTDGGFTYDSYLSQAVVDGGLDEGFEYSVKAREVLPSPQELDIASAEFLTPVQYGDWTALPDALDPRIGIIARNWTQEAPTAYRKVLAIQDRFQSDFGYDKGVDLLGDTEALLRFLTETQVGGCQQFAVSMAAMVRSLGIPARVAAGYQQGTETETGTFLVQTKDAHAWVEVYFPDYGWLVFEPTPGRGVRPATMIDTYLNPTALAPAGPDPSIPELQPVPGGPGAQGCQGIPGQLCNTERVNPGATRGVDALPPGLVQGTGPSPEEESRYSVPYRLIMLGLLALAALLLIVIPIVKATARRMMLRRSREPREHVLAAYRVFDSEATDIGMGRQEGETVTEHRARLVATVAFSDGHLGRLTDAAVRAAYSAEQPTREEANASVEDAHAAVKDLRRHTGLVRRIVGSYRPGV
ncbi:MAG TPA: transglutaminaseTgpA domain-containing protein [Actinomycetota bacterium]|nr:transglutaminaseTgpA domain-containing protein [Actinomycetota bacterium]